MFSSLAGAERWTRRLGLVLIIGTLATLLWGLGQGTKRPTGAHSGRVPALLRRRVFYLLATVGYTGLCYRLWRPLPLTLSRRWRAVAFILGTLLTFPGVTLVLWGRLTLGEMYFASSSLGAQLYGEHQLVTTGPFAYVRHPMYLGMMIMALGGLLLYRTWTFLLLLSNLPALLIRAWREEEVLAQAFAAEWADYHRRVPGWIPRCFCKRPSHA